MEKAIQKLKIIWLFFLCNSALAMDPVSPINPRKKIDRDCVRAFQLFKPETARQLGISLNNISPQRLIITPDEKGIVAALGNGQIIFRKIVESDNIILRKNVEFDNRIELLADGAGVKGAAMIATGQRTKTNEIIVACAVNHKKIFFYDGAEIKKFVARFEVWAKKNPYDKNAVFVQKRVSRLEHYIQDIGINTQGAHIMATIEFPKPFLKDNRSSLVIRDLFKINESNAHWSNEGSWWSHLVINDEGNLVACSDTNGTIWIFEIKKGDTGMILPPPITIPTKDRISQLNYPSKIAMWYATDNNQLKMLDVRKYLGLIDVARCVTDVSFEGLFSPHYVFVMEICPKFSVAYWLKDPQDDENINIFFRREKDVFDQEDNSQKMICTMGSVVNGAFLYENDSGQRIMEKGRIHSVAVQGNVLVAVANNGKIMVYKLTERCGLIINQRSKSDSCIIISHRSGNKNIPVTKKEDRADIIGKAVSLDILNESKKLKTGSAPLQTNTVKAISTEKLNDCDSKQKKKVRKFSLNEHFRKGKNEDFQESVRRNTISDYTEKDIVKDEDSQKNK